jgi:hypothetical protein
VYKRTRSRDNWKRCPTSASAVTVRSAFCANHEGLARKTLRFRRLRLLSSRRTKGLSPIPQLFPRLNEFLDRARRWKRSAIDDSAPAVSLLVEVQNGRPAEVRQAAAECCEIFRRHHVFMLRGIRSPRHSEKHRRAGARSYQAHKDEDADQSVADFEDVKR